MVLRESIIDYPSDHVIFINDNTAIVGQRHGEPLEIKSPEIIEKIKELSEDYGAWSEGNRSDEVHTKGIIDNYKGSWDDLFNDSIKGYPVEFIATIFSNVRENDTLNQIGVNPDNSIFDQIMKSQDNHNAIPNRYYNSSTLVEFLKQMSDAGHDFLAMSKKKATRENLENFLSVGEKLMWGAHTYNDTNAGEMARKYNEARDKFLIKQKQGVFVTGLDHLLSVSDLLRR